MANELVSRGHVSWTTRLLRVPLEEALRLSEEAEALVAHAVKSHGEHPPIRVRLAHSHALDLMDEIRQVLAELS